MDHSAVSFYFAMFRYEECEVPDCSGHGHCQVAANNPQNISQDIFQNISQNCQEAGPKNADFSIAQNRYHNYPKLFGIQGAHYDRCHPQYCLA